MNQEESANEYYAKLGNNPRKPPAINSTAIAASNKPITRVDMTMVRLLKCCANQGKNLKHKIKDALTNKIHSVIAT